jgi:hypothetical protein
MPLLEERFSPSPSTMPEPSSRKWWPIKARGGKKTTKGMHTVKEADMLAAKIDLLLSRLNERAHKKEAMKATV